MSDEVVSDGKVSRVSYTTIIALVFLLGPLSISLAAYSIAGALNCTLNEANYHSCVFLGLDIGGVLYPMGSFGFLGIITMPVGLVIILYKMIKR
jgi:hypothetical protein